MFLRLRARAGVDVTVGFDTASAYPDVGGSAGVRTSTRLESFHIDAFVCGIGVGAGGGDGLRTRQSLSRRGGGKVGSECNVT